MTTVTRGWSKERRKKQAEICRKNRPSQFSTGPKTTRGKAASSLNALKHGLRSETVQMLRKVLRAQKAWAKRIKDAGNL